MFWNQLGLTPEELCSVSWGIFMRCRIHIHTPINNICIRILCRCNWAQYGHQDFQSATGGLKCHSGCQWCIPKKHYKLLCRFLDWSWRLSGIYLKITTNIYVVFSGSLEDLLLDPLVFVVTLYPGWGCTFVVIFFWPVHGKCSDWGWAELLYSYKILTQQSSPNTNPDEIDGKTIRTFSHHDEWSLLWQQHDIREIYPMKWLCIAN